MLGELKYRMFVLSQRADRPDEPWVVEDVILPGSVDLEKKLAEYLQSSIGRPYPLNWSLCHEEWTIARTDGTYKVAAACKRAVVDNALTFMEHPLDQMRIALEQMVIGLRNIVTCIKDARRM